MKRLACLALVGLFVPAGAAPAAVDPGQVQEAIKKGADFLKKFQPGNAGQSHGHAAGLASLRRLQRLLAAAMTDAGIGRYVRSRFKPHMTLLYDRKYVAPQPIRPLRWTANEVVLIDSLVGRSQHIVLGRWPLQSRQMGF